MLTLKTFADLYKLCINFTKMGKKTLDSTFQYSSVTDTYVLMFLFFLSSRRWFITQEI